MKAAGAGVLAAAASAGALGALNPRIAEASDGLPATKAGVTDFGDTAGLFQEVPVPMRTIPVRDVETDIDRQGDHP